MIDRADIGAAAGRITGRVRRTPVLELEAGALGVDHPLILKLEHHQHAGSFKARGALNLLLSGAVPPAGVVAASGGNFGLAVAWAAGAVGVPATVFVPDSTAPAKRAALDRLGAEVVVGGAYYADAYEASAARAAATGALLAHAYDDVAVVAGAGTLAAELNEQVPDADTVLVAVGGAGLVGGIASWYRGDVRVVAVETDTTPTLHRALAAGEPVDVDVSGPAADALGARRVGRLGFEAAQRWVDRSLLVSDVSLDAARTQLWRTARVACELASAAPLAALRSGAYVPRGGERVVVVVCGANVDPRSLDGHR